MTRIEELLAELVSIPTVNDPSRGQRVGPREGEAVQRVLAAAGLETDIHVEDGVPTLLAVRGEGRPVTLFMAHFDVVPPGPGWTVTEPFNPLIAGDRLYGRGSADDKSNVAAITVALADYEPPSGTLIIAFTGDEEIGGSRGAGWLARALEKEGLWPDYVVNGDGSLSRVITRRRNAFTALVRVRAEEEPGRGTPAERRFESRILLRETMHSAYFTPGVDAHALVAASLWARDREAPVTGLEGEWVKNNVVPRSATLHYLEGGGRAYYDAGLTRLVYAILPLARAPIPTEKYSDYGVTVNPNVYTLGEGWHELTLDIRAMTMDSRAIEGTLAAVLEEALPGSSLKVRGGRGYLYTPPAARLVREAARINEGLGLPGAPVEAGGASDSRYFSPRGAEAIDYGPLGANIHGPNEYVSIPHLYKAARFYRELAKAIHG